MEGAAAAMAQGLLNDNALIWLAIFETVAAAAGGGGGRETDTALAISAAFVLLLSMLRCLRVK